MSLKLTTYYTSEAIPPLPGVDTFHSTELFRIYEATPGYRPLLVVASEDEVPVAKLLGVIRSGKHMGLPSLIRRCEVFGFGEYFPDTTSADGKRQKESLFGEMLQRLTQEALRYSFLIVFRNLDNGLFGYGLFQKQGYFAMNWLRVYNSLHSVKRVEERFSLSRLRQIRRGEKNGAVTAVAQTEEEVKAFAEMLYRNYSFKIRRHFPDPTFFEQMVKHLTADEQSRIFIVKYHDRIIGGSVCIYSGSTAYLWFSGGLRKSYLLQYPGILAVWKAMADAKERGYEHFEFIDVGLPFRHHGYHEFVLRFGGKQTSTRRWFHFRWKWLNRILVYLYS